MKKLILHFICAVLVISAFCAQAINAVALTEPTISVGDKTCNPGNEISLSVSLENNPGIMYLSATPKCYDEAGEETDYITIASVENGELFSLEEGINLIFDSDGNVEENGTLCTLHIAVAEDAPYGEYSVELILRESYNSSEQDVEVDITAGTVTVEKPHTPAAAVKENEVPATCTANGSYDSVVYCEDCGEELSRETKVVASKGHTLVTLKAKAATCTATGLTEGKKCSVCDTVTKKQETVAKKAHSLVTLKAKAATCTASGLTEGKKCSVCDTVTKKQETIAKKGHKEVTIKAVAATCTKVGKTAGKKCSVCGTVTQKQKEVAKKAHSYKTTTTKATLSKNGKTVKKCTVCDKVADTTTIYAAKTVKLSKTKFTYTGKTIKPTLVVQNSKGKAIASSNYTVSGTRSTKNIGTYKFTITFKGNYKGSKTLTYTVNPKTVSSLKLVSGKKQMTVSYKKDTSVGGYEILYATNSKFTKGKKTIKLSSANTAKTTIKKLVSKKTYYVKVRAFKKVSGKTYYGAYSSVKKIKVK